MPGRVGPCGKVPAFLVPKAAAKAILWQTVARIELLEPAREQLSTRSGPCLLPDGDLGPYEEVQADPYREEPLGSVAGPSRMRMGGR